MSFGQLRSPRFNNVLDNPTPPAGNQFTQSLTGGLSFTGPINLTNSITKVLAAGLSFTGITNLIKVIAHGLAGGLSFTGSILKRTSKQLTSATLSFTGSFVKGALHFATLTAGLSFTGPTNLVKTTSKLMNGGLSFIGPTNLIKATTHGLSAGLSFTGIFVKKTSKTLTVASLSFTGAFQRTFVKIFSATLSFTGPTNLIKVTSHALTGGLSFTGSFIKRLTRTLIGATLSFTGTFTKQARRSFTGGLSFTGPVNLVKAIKHGLTAGLSFTGSFSKFIKKTISAALSFTGAFTPTKQGGVLNLQSFTAGLSFTGVQVKKTTHNLNGALSFTGISNLGKAIRKGITATLSFTVNWTGFRPPIWNFITTIIGTLQQNFTGTDSASQNLNSSSMIDTVNNPSVSSIETGENDKQNISTNITNKNIGG